MEPRGKEKTRLIHRLNPPSKASENIGMCGTISEITYTKSNTFIYLVTEMKFALMP